MHDQLVDDENLLQNCITLCFEHVRVNRSRALAQFATKLFMARDGTIQLERQSILKKLVLYVESILLRTTPNDCRCSALAKLRILRSSGPDQKSELMSVIQDYCTSRVATASIEPFSYIDSLSSVQTQHHDAAWDSITDDEPAEKHDFAHAVLYSSLERNIVCKCAATSPARMHQGCLRLHGIITNDGQDKDLYYDTAFARCSSPSDEEPSWARIRFQVSRSNSSKKKARHVGFAIDAPSPASLALSATPTQLAHRPGVATDLCEILNIDAGPVHLCVRATKDKLFDHQESQPIEYELAAQRSESLATLIQEHDLSDVGKIRLAYIIIYAVWSYYESRWMSCRWTVNDVHFIRRHGQAAEHENTVSLDPCSPFIHMPFSTAQPRQNVTNNEFLQGQRNIHPAPRILALGVILVTIFWGPVRASAGDDTVVNLNREFFECNKLLANKLPLSLDDESLQSVVHDAISACFEYRELEDPESNICERRAYLYEHVVRPLRWLIQNGGKSFDLKQASWQAKNQPSSADDLTSDSLMPVHSFSNTPHQGRDNGSFSSNRQTKTASDWMTNIIESVLSRRIKAAFASSKPELRERTRIAILDTGYDRESVYFSDAGPRKRVAKWRDFVAPGSTEACDMSSSGHGTFILSLAMRLAPRADFLVARIAADDDDLKGKDAVAVGRIAEAIKWAASEKADIISMSFGFDQDQKPIQHEIDRLVTDRSHRILFFAAASNEGGNTVREDFPARHPYVFAVHSTDHHGNLSQFDTKSAVTEANVIGTLGQDIPGYVSRTAKTSIKGMATDSGTSLATAVAAAIAALVLDDVQLSISVSPSNARFEHLYTFEGMKRMLFDCDQMGRTYSGFRYLDPMRFFNEHEQRRWEIMAYLCPSLSCMY